MKWKHISEFNGKNTKKPVLIKINACGGPFVAIAHFKKHPLEFSWKIIGTAEGDGGVWNEKCVKWWYPIKLPSGHKKLASRKI